jgi:hypothetical protein
MNKFLGLGLSAILVLSNAPKANADLGWFKDAWEVFGGGIKAGGSVNFGALEHNAFWGFCSSNGYRSYYNRDNVFLCGYDEYNHQENQPQGDVYSYDQVCNGYYGNNATYKWSDGTCESQSYNN